MFNKRERIQFIGLLFLLIAILACRPTTETPTPTPPTPVRPTATPLRPAETAAPTPVQPTAEASPGPTNTTQPGESELAILSFTADIEDRLGGGKRLTFHVQTTGAEWATVWSGASQRFFYSWPVPVNGSQTVELSVSYFRDPSMTLIAGDSLGNEVSASVTVPWPCEHDYFFTTDIAACPLDEAISSWAAEQSFEHGKMIWLEEVTTDSRAWQRVILVFYDDNNHYAQYFDTWTDAEPESDPSIVPPAGLLQPVRGFGKVWRENSNVREQLGWALSPEQGFDTTWQQQVRESFPGAALVRMLDGEVRLIHGWATTGGSWESVGP